MAMKGRSVHTTFKSVCQRRRMQDAHSNLMSRITTRLVPLPPSLITYLQSLGSRCTAPLTLRSQAPTAQ